MITFVTEICYFFDSIGLVKKGQPTGDSIEETVEIGDGYRISKTFDSFIKISYSSNPSLFFRKLVFDSGLFTLDEVASSSVTGKRTFQSPEEARPALNQLKLKILKGKS